MGLRWGRVKSAAPWHREGEVTPSTQPQHRSLGQAAWGGRASSADDLITHIKGWQECRRLVRCTGELTLESREDLQSRICSFWELHPVLNATSGDQTPGS